MKPAEPLFTCPVCHTANFSSKGLIAHCCRAKPGRARLTLDERRQALTDHVRALPPFHSTLSSRSPSMPKAKSNSTPPKGALVVLGDSSLTLAASQLKKLQSQTIEALELIAKTEQWNTGRRVLVGLVLHFVKQNLKHGEFMPWLKANVKGTGYTQCTYMMRIAAAFVEKSKVESADLRALTAGNGSALLLSKPDKAKGKVADSIKDFVGDLAWTELLDEHGILDAKKIGGARESDKPAAAGPVDPEQLYLQSRDEAGGAIQRAEDLFLKENILQHLAGHPEEIRGVVDSLRSLAAKVEAAAAPLLKK